MVITRQGETVDVRLSTQRVQPDAADREPLGWGRPPITIRLHLLWDCIAGNRHKRPVLQEYAAKRVLLARQGQSLHAAA